MKFKLNKKELSLKQKISIVVCVSGIFTGLLWIKGQNKTLIVDGVVTRPGYNQLSEQMNLDVQVDGESDTYNTQIEIQPQAYSLDEIQVQFDYAYEALIEIILQDNESLSEVTTDLYLPNNMEDAPISLSWYSDNYDRLDSSGMIHNEDLHEGNQITVCLTVHMEYMKYTAEYQYTVLIQSKNRSVYEEQIYNLQSAIMDAEQSDVQSNQIELPDQINGNNVSYFIHNESTSPFVVLLLGGVAIVVLIYGEKEKQHKQQRDKDNQLEEDYAGLITKLTLLIGSGMTIRRSWETIVKDYLQCTTEKGMTRHYVYEEMSNSLNEMKSGVSEASVYGTFGKRCKRKEYLKLGTLLQQNLKKGTRDLLTLLQQESIEAFEERKNRARRKGEEAGTKLLLPMILMLLVVMAIVMVPALMSFQIA